MRHRRRPTYDVVTYDVHTISSKPTMSYVLTTMSYCIHRMRYRRLNQLHRMLHRIRRLHCFRSGDPNPYCCILHSPSDCFLYCSVFIAVHSTQIKPAPLLPCRHAPTLYSYDWPALRPRQQHHRWLQVPRTRQARNEDLDAHWRKLARSPADQNNVKHQRRKITFVIYQWREMKQIVLWSGRLWHLLDICCQSSAASNDSILWSVCSVSIHTLWWFFREKD